MAVSLGHLKLFSVTEQVSSVAVHMILIEEAAIWNFGWPTGCPNGDFIWILPVLLDKYEDFLIFFLLLLVG
jgi:hypothetical protein